MPLLDVEHCYELWDLQLPFYQPPNLKRNAYPESLQEFVKIYGATAIFVKLQEDFFDVISFKVDAIVV